ncbi:hypothetical protein PIROE2DRAFT_14237 [Piromyces sp. E2]|nr:hypothetical protein PIROE2DRAFT_14237 [Piromyces sp. E2]|eukprot:OUM60078.1 hypothetical protein PIROE2DRAFT_14237 [Piromyces sp. E2]
MRNNVPIYEYSCETCGRNKIGSNIRSNLYRYPINHVNSSVWTLSFIFPTQKIVHYFLLTESFDNVSPNKEYSINHCIIKKQIPS